MSLRMRRATPVILALALVLALLPSTARALSPDPTLKEAQAACVIDGEGRLLYAREENTEMAFASITKVMTAMVALDAGIPFDQVCEIQATEFDETAQVTGFKAGDTITFGDLLRVALVFSANDAATNIAYIVGGSEEGFAELMNQKAAEIGLEHTHFMNSHGLEEPDHYSCAYDLCVMGRYALEHYPTIRDLVHTPTITVKVNDAEYTFYTTDELLGVYEGIRGIKTGRTESGTAFLASCQRSGVTLYSCVLRCETLEGRFDDTRTLLDWAFEQYPERTLKQGGWMLRMAPWEDGFWLSCPISASHAVKAHPFADEQTSYSIIMSRQNTRVAGGSTYGNTIWRQGDQYLAGVTYEAGRPTQSKAWNPLTLPLFATDEEQGA